MDQNHCTSCSLVVMAVDELPFTFVDVVVEVDDEDPSNNLLDDFILVHFFHSSIYIKI